MRQITDKSVQALKLGHTFSSGNTNVSPTHKGVNFHLHGHLIAQKTNEGLFITNCGYFTNVTKERLNGILEAHGFTKIYQKAGVWYLNGQAWDGELTKIN